MAIYTEFALKLEAIKLRSKASGGMERGLAKVQSKKWVVTEQSMRKS